MQSQLLKTNLDTVEPVDRTNVYRHVRPAVADVLAKIPLKDRAIGHGKCAEVMIITEALNAGVTLRGGKSASVVVGGLAKSKSGKVLEGVEKAAREGFAHGTPRPACASCKVLLKYFDITNIVK